MSDFKHTPKEATDGFTVIPVGDYNVKIENAETGFSAAKKTPMITLTCAIISNEGVKGKLFERLLFQENCAWKIDQVRSALGFDDTLDEEVDIDPDAFVGCEGWVRVGHREYNGKTSSEITAWVFNEFEIEQLNEQAYGAINESVVKMETDEGVPF